jgi:hypothetical protein
MNDTELDRLLNTWKVPEPAQSLRDGLGARLSRGERHSFARRLRWTLVLASISAALAVAMAESTAGNWDLALGRILGRLYEEFVKGQEASRTEEIVAKIRQSQPRVYVDGELAAPLEYGHAASLVIQVPGEGVYSVLFYRYIDQRTADGRPTGWIEAGYIRRNMIEIRVGSRRVRIECNQAITDTDGPVFTRRIPSN